MTTIDYKAVCQLTTDYWPQMWLHVDFIIDYRMTDKVDCQLTTCWLHNWLQNDWQSWLSVDHMLTGTAIDYRLTNRTADRLQVDWTPIDYKAVCQLTNHRLLTWPQMWTINLQMWLQLTTGWVWLLTTGYNVAMDWLTTINDLQWMDWLSWSHWFEPALNFISF